MSSGGGKSTWGTGEGVPDSGPETFEGFVHYQLGSAKALGTAAALLAEGEHPDRLDPTDRAAFAHGMLRWAVSDEPGPAVHWSALSRAGRKELDDRDTYVLRLWRALKSHPAHRPFRETYFDAWQVEEHYEDRLFRWFLARLDLPAALRLHVGKPTAWSFHLTFLVLAVGLTWARFAVFGTSAMGSPGVAAGLVALLAGAFVLLRRRSLPAGAFLQALVPRMGAAVGVGYLFLLAAPHLLAVLTRWQGPRPLQLGLGLVAVAGVWAYAVFESMARVEPAPRFRRAAARALPIVATGAAHALLGLALLAPLLAVALESTEPGLLPQLHDLLLWAVFALGLGVPLELAWGEKPMTEPL